MSKWLCVGCGNVVEDDCIQAGCRVCRRRALDSFWDKYGEQIVNGKDEENEGDA